ncbi:ACT domain-containing protein [Gammaproteobacteria bacterium AB-CW1]|uniref:ACT domain-containing protein n=1 Tax=Natronospira elongata TaxID=3110268 RepID=A0AAP6MMJ3_9GAMM|nr:ACT domain-containing protein [Gammaproteobacteria bacterium AB-CW1]
MIQHLTVIADTRTGLMADVSTALAEAGINIASVEAVEVADKACLRLEVDQLDAALDTLNRKGMTVVAEDVVLLRVADRPGALATISQQLAEADIDIRAITMVHRDESENIVALACEKPDQARELLGQWLV